MKYHFQQMLWEHTLIPVRLSAEIAIFICRVKLPYSRITRIISPLIHLQKIHRHPTRLRPEPDRSGRTPRDPPAPLAGRKKSRPPPASAQRTSLQGHPFSLALVPHLGRHVLDPRRVGHGAGRDGQGGRYASIGRWTGPADVHFGRTAPHGRDGARPSTSLEGHAP